MRKAGAESIIVKRGRKVVKVLSLSPEKPDLVNHPSHYNSGRIEVIEAIEDWRLDYHRGNAVKYIARAGIKHATTEVEDLRKAIWYIARRIETLTAITEGRDTLRPNNMKQKA
jgi:hypothetical protein